jgi:GT2 family glycosyltransferase
MGMIGLPDAVYADPDVIAATRAALHRYGNAPMVQPTHVQLLAALTS